MLRHDAMNCALGWRRLKTTNGIGRWSGMRRGKLDKLFEEERRVWCGPPPQIWTPL